MRVRVLWGEDEAGKEKNHSILTTKKLDYTTAKQVMQIPQ